MIRYTYKAKDETGKAHSGRLEAESDDDFYSFLSQRKWYCVSVDKKDIDAEERNESVYKFKSKELAVFSREFAIMLSAGITMFTALHLLYDRCTKERQKKCYMHLIEMIEKGLTLHEAMKRMGNTFPDLLKSMVFAGESSGNLDVVMKKMAEYYERDHRLKGKIQTAMIYPILLLVITGGVVILLFTFVLPQFFDMLEGQDLNLLTKFYMAVSVFLTNRWYIAIGIILLLVLLFYVLSKNASCRFGFDKVKLKLPVFGKLVEKILIARFANGMNILYSSGISILQSLEICGNILSNLYLKQKLENAMEMVEKGTSLSDALEKQNLFDPMVWSMIHIGEESGSLDEMFFKLSEYYEEESETSTQKLMALMEPVMLIVIALIVGSVVASVLLPIYGSYQTI